MFKTKETIAISECVYSRNKREKVDKKHTVTIDTGRGILYLCCNLIRACCFNGQYQGAAVLSIIRNVEVFVEGFSL